MSNNTDVKMLRNKLFFNHINIYSIVSDKELKYVESFAEDYKKFLNDAKTEREAISYFLKSANENGFEEFDVDKKYEPGSRVYRINREKSVAFAIIGKEGCKNGF
ncbi:MAG: aminopeptidase, partial [Firmicutes bacterium]|nr:aminopeptidase [Bacillota bacterium]